jgi:hypothetical protein
MITLIHEGDASRASDSEDGRHFLSTRTTVSTPVIRAEHHPLPDIKWGHEQMSAWLRDRHERPHTD